MTTFPALRTTPQTDKTGRPLLAGTFVVLIAIPLACGAVYAGISALPWADEATPGQGNVFLFLLAAFAFSPLYAGPLTLLGLPLAWAALRRGWAGWGVAAGVGAVLAGVMGVILEGGFLALAEISRAVPLVFAGFGALYGLFFWLGARLLAPRAEAWRVPPT